MGTPALPLRLLDLSSALERLRQEATHCATECPLLAHCERRPRLRLTVLLCRRVAKTGSLRHPSSARLL